MNLEEVLREICPLELHLTVHMVVVQQGQLDVICLWDVAETSLGKRVQPKFEWNTACHRMFRLELVRVIDLWHNLKRHSLALERIGTSILEVWERHCRGVDCFGPEHTAFRLIRITSNRESG